MEILHKISSCQEEDILSYFQDGIKHLVRLDMTVTYTVLCFHNIKILHNLIKSEVLCSCIEK